MSKSVFENSRFGERVTTERHDQPGAEKPENDEESPEPRHNDNGFKDDDLWRPATGYVERDYAWPSPPRGR